jgi:CheY-like chemotaxis protein
MSECMILLVEDHVLLRGILSKALSALGYEVHTAASADEALTLLEDGLMPQLVLTDIRTPGRHNGLDVARWLKSNRPAIPVLLQTGFAQEPTAEFPILHKPYSPEELSEAIHRLLRT